MKRLSGPVFDPFRVDLEKMPADHPFMKANPGGVVQNATNGAFVFPFRVPRRGDPSTPVDPVPKEDPDYPSVAPKAALFVRVIAASGAGWDHVSVSCADLARELTPTWAIMEWVKRRFFLPHEVVMQLHVAEKDHISIHPHVLHLWRPHDKRIPLPPKRLV
jgi:hypothetical protein